MDVVVMPQLGETVVEGTITSWAKAVGDAVAVDETLFDVSTEKVDTEVPSAVAGYLRLVLVEEGEAVPIGTPVAVITATADEPLDPPGGTGSGLSTDAAPSTPSPDPDPSASNRRRFDAIAPDGSQGSGRVAAPHEAAGATGASQIASNPARGAADGSQFASNRRRFDAHGSAPSTVVSPVVRRLLEEHGLELGDVAGSGREGRVTRNDVLAAAAQRARAELPGPADPSNLSNRLGPTVEPGPDDEIVPLSRARMATAEHLHRSVSAAAHALVVVEVDWTAVDRTRRGRRLSYLPFVARAAIDALGRFPHLNASFDTDRLVVHRRIHLGIAVDVEQEALLVPVVHDAHELRLQALADAVAERADQARRHRLPGDAFDGGTFTLTNVGSYGTVLAAPIISQPQVAILSTDGVRMRPTAVEQPDGSWSVGIRPLGNLSLSFDHRAVDGAYAAAFLADVRDTLQERDWSVEVAA